jgi:hypothetical protein
MDVVGHSSQQRLEIVGGNENARERHGRVIGRAGPRKWSRVT